jgi:hypothetical protein
LIGSLLKFPSGWFPHIIEGVSLVHEAFKALEWEAKLEIEKK